jgi:serine phosphatase RsbU (regulator of sigma subunit)
VPYFFVNLVKHIKVTIIFKVSQIIEKAKSFEKSDLKKAFNLAEEALNKSLEINDRKSEADCRLYLSSLYLRVYNYEKIMEHTSEAIKYYISADDYKKVAECYHYFGWVYYFLEDNEKRLESNLKCLKYKRKAGDAEGEVSTLNNIGDTYLQMGNFEKALYYFNLCLQIPDKSPKTQAIVVLNIGETYFKAKQYDKAIPFIEEGLKLAGNTNYSSMYVAGNVMLGTIYLDRNELPKAKTYLDNALDEAVKTKNEEFLSEVYKVFARYYEKNNQSQKAYDYLNKHIALKDKILKENNIKRIQRLQLGFDIDSLKNEALRQKEINKKLKKAFLQIEQQNKQIELFNKEIKDSIRYAKRIQEILITPNRQIFKHLKQCAYFYLPKDIVSGDFYWTFFNGNDIYFALADCTGHGVPGAFMSVLGISSLNEIMSENNTASPAEILNKLQYKILQYLNNSAKNRDGMDIFLIKYTLNSQQLQFAGANNSMFLLSKKHYLQEQDYKRKTEENGFVLYELRGDKQPIGFYEYFTPFNNYQIRLLDNSVLYFFTDGYADQFGGPKGKKLMLTELKKILLKNANLPLKQQKDELEQYFNSWKGNHEQIDDVSFFGLQFK